MLIYRLMLEMHNS